MVTHLYLLSYNNYLNRQVKWHESTNLYLEEDAQVISNYNFNPNDGINTEIVLNISDISAPDYIVVVDDSNNIVSRWFIIDRQRIRAGQSKFTLRRDVIVDNFNAIKTAPCFIEKAMLGFDDVRIFNKENMSFNQIKTSEKLLKDKTGCPWIIGYYDKNSNIRGNKVTDEEYENIGSIPTNDPLSMPFIQLATPIDQWEFYDASNLKGTEDEAFYTDVANGYTYNIKINDSVRSGHTYYNNLIKVYPNGATTYHCTYNYTPEEIETYNTYGISALRSDGKSALDGDPYGGYEGTLRALPQILRRSVNEIEGGLDYLKSISASYLGGSAQSLQELINLQGKVLRDSDGRVYRVANVTIGEWEEKEVAAAPKNSLFLGMDAIMDQARDEVNNQGLPYFSGTANKYTYALIGSVRKYSVALTPLYSEQLTYDMSGGKLFTTDAPYNIFAIPYGEINVYTLLDGEQTLCKTSAEIAINTAMAIQKNNPGIVYDIQILPYCPMQGLIDPQYEQEIYLTSENQYSTINKGDEVKGVILNVPNGRFTFTIQHSIQTATDAIERKVNNECDMWRLCSPNYNGAFEFSVEKNGGVDFFDVDCEYKPFSPYIHINPDFGGLYGQDFNDPRGLICGGDFSITQIVDQWQQYQIQNKNFQNIFDRQIENMETNQDIQRKMQLWSMHAGFAQGGATGVGAGAMVGGMFGPVGMGIGAAVGAGVGLGASIGGGLLDLYYSDKLRSEAINFAQDNFGYQLGNIQALPTMLTRVSAFNNNNKLFPVLEYYTCTEIEKQALRDKIKYNGMTVGTIGKIEDFTNSNLEEVYIKGQIIRIDLPDDYHMTNSIAGEVNKGFYFLGGSE